MRFRKITLIKNFLKKYRSHINWVLSVIVAFYIGNFLPEIKHFIIKGNPDHYELNGDAKEAIIFDKNHLPLGKIQLTREIQYLKIIDIDKDKKNELILMLDDQHTNSCILQIYSFKLKLENELHLYDEQIMSTVRKDQLPGEIDHDPSFKLVKIEYLKDDKTIAILVKNPRYWPSRFCVVDAVEFLSGSKENLLIRDYWHVGQLQDFRIADIDNDGSKNAVLIGYNNPISDLMGFPLESFSDCITTDRKYLPICSVISLNNKIDQSCPPAWDTLDIPFAKEVLYFIIPDFRIDNLKLYDKDGDSIPDIYFNTKTGYNYYINYKCEVITDGPEKEYLPHIWQLIKCDTLSKFKKCSFK